MNSFVQAISQVCVISKDIVATARGFNQLGIGPFKCWYYQPPTLFNTELRKKPQFYTMKLGFAWIDGMEIEIIQPMEGESIYREFLAASGDYLHHMMLSSASFSGAIERMEQQHLPVLQSGQVNPPLVVGGITMPPLPDL